MLVDLKGRDIICTQELSVEEIKALLKLANEMKADRYGDKYTSLMKYQTFLMMFYNPSLRTRSSFEAAATELGGHAQFLEPKAMRLKKTKDGVEVTAGETIEDAAKALDRYGVGIGIRMLETSVENYGEGNDAIREYAKHMKMPVINMADDKYHPCQGLADVQGMQEHKGNLEGKTVLMTWAHGALARSYCSVHENLLITSRLGMNVRLAFPKGYDLPEEEIERVRANCKANGKKFEICNNVDEAYTKDVEFVYSRNWFGPDFYEMIKKTNADEGKKKEIARAMSYPEWITTQERMNRTNNALYLHPMPVDRGKEVTDEVCSGPNSIIYDIAENRLHAQKAIMAMTIAGVKVEI